MFIAIERVIIINFDAELINFRYGNCKSTFRYCIQMAHGR